jgi:hypothetical protein
MSFQIQKAQRQKAKLRVGLSGPSGAGKTYSALLLAAGLTGDWAKVCLIDTENGSGSLYSDLGPYNVITLTAPFSPERYIEAIKSAEDAGMEVIVVDSVSHEWDGKGGSLEINETLAQAKYRGNTWAAWSETTPRHQKFIEAIVQSPAHIITTVRNKIETMQTEDKKVKKVGTKEIQREGFEYELTVNFNVDRENHLVVASKDRTGLFIHRDPFVITEETGEALRAWNESGAEVPVDVPREKAKVMHNLKRLGFSGQIDGDGVAKGGKVLDIVQVLTGLDIASEKLLPEAVRKLEGWTDPEGAQATYGMAVQDRQRDAHAAGGEGVSSNSDNN